MGRSNVERRYAAALTVTWAECAIPASGDRHTAPDREPSGPAIGSARGERDVLQRHSAHATRADPVERSASSVVMVGGHRVRERRRGAALGKAEQG